MKAIRLQTADLTQPLGLDVRVPRFTWNAQGGIRQTAYRLVAVSEDETLLFDSGRVETDAMNCIYEGSPLQSRQQVTWKVCLWDETGAEEWSEAAVFEMGLLSEDDWCAKWITGVDTDRAKRLPADCFRKIFAVTKPVQKARLYATALGTYEACINGQKVSDVLAPGTTDYEKRLYDQTYDVTACLRGGRDTGNVLTFTVADGWYKGKLGADQKEFFFGTQLALLAQLEITYTDGSQEVIGTDETFDWCNDGPVCFTDLKDGEVYDARNVPSFGHKAILAPEAVQRIVPTASNAAPIAEHEHFEAALMESPSGQMILDFGQNMAGYVAFRVHEPAGTQIRLRLFEATDHGEFSDASLSFPEGNNVPTVRQEIIYTAAGAEGEEFHPAFFYAGFRYAMAERRPAADDIAGKGDAAGKETALFTGSADGWEPFAADPADFWAIAVYSDLEYEGTFACSNPKVTQFYNNTVWSMKSNFVDVPTDCPQREKSGWTGDAQVFCSTAVSIAQTEAFYRKWLKDVRDNQREDGTVRNVNPTCHRPGGNMDMLDGSTGWADAAVIIPYLLWKRTGDVSFIRDNLDLMQGWKDRLVAVCRDKSLFDPNLPEPYAQMVPLYQAYKLKDSEWNQYIPEAGMHWGEWLVPKSQEPPEVDDVTALIAPKQALTCAYACYSMGLLADMLEVLDYNEEAAFCRAHAEGSRRAFHVHWVNNGTIETNHMAELVRPLALGLLTDEEKKNVAAKLNHMVFARNYKVGTGFLSTPFLLPVLAENGYIESAYRMLENEEAPGWLAMVNQGATTVWEDYECYDAEGHPVAKSFNHYSPGAVVGFLFDTVCGIRVDGENHVTIAPQPGGSLTFAKAKTRTPYGVVESGWEKGEDGKTVYTVSIPANVTAQIVLPDGKKCDVTAGTYRF